MLPPTRSVSVFLEEGKHDVEIEFISNNFAQISFDIKSLAEIEQRYNSSTTQAVPPSSTIHYVMVGKTATTKAKVSLSSSFSPEYLILASIEGLNWEFSGDVSSLKGVIVTSMSGRSTVSGLKKETLVAYPNDSTSKDYIPFVSTLDYNCDKALVYSDAVTPSKTIIPAHCYQVSPESPAALLGYLKKRDYTLGSFTATDDKNPILVLPSKTFSSNGDFQTYYENNIKTEKQKVGL